MPRGRPKNGKANRTEGVRVRADLEEMVRLICRLQGVKSAELLDHLIRFPIIQWYTDLYPLLRQMKSVEDAARAIRGEEPSAPLPQVAVRDPKTMGMITLEELHQKYLGAGKSQHELIPTTEPPQTAPDHRKGQWFNTQDGRQVPVHPQSMMAMGRVPDPIGEEATKKAQKSTKKPKS
jgi:hypothetical protein